MVTTEATETWAPYVVIVTGSRHLDHFHGLLVHRELNTAFEHARAHGRHLVVRHGACPTGADHHAGEWVARRSVTTVTEQRFPVDWSRPCEPSCRQPGGHGERRVDHDGNDFCPAAGPLRNRDMVTAGADKVLAFPLGPSRGTRGCMRLAREAGLDVYVPPELRTRRDAA